MVNDVIVCYCAGVQEAAHWISVIQPGIYE